MTWLSQDDRDRNAEYEAAGRAAKARAEGSFTKISVFVLASYPKLTSSTTIALPRAMTSADALDYAKSIGHRTVDGFYDAAGTFYRHE